MADFPLLEGQRYLAGATLTGSAGVAISPSATAHTKGSYTAVITAANNTTGGQGLLLTVHANAAAGIDYLLDVAVGAAAAEQIFAANLLASFSDAPLALTYYLPIALVSGVRIAARCQTSATSGAALRVGAQMMTAGFLPSQPLTRTESLGLNTGTTRGTSIDAGGTANTKGSWTQLSASTAFDYSALVVAVGNQQATSGRAASDFLIDVGVGASGSEQVVIPNLFVSNAVGTVSVVGPQAYPPLMMQVPAGSAISARASCSSNSATARVLDVACYGIG